MRHLAAPSALRLSSSIMSESLAVPRRERLRAFLRGNGRQVFEARVAATILMTGVLIGFLLG